MKLSSFIYDSKVADHEFTENNSHHNHQKYNQMPLKDLAPIFLD